MYTTVYTDLLRIWVNGLAFATEKNVFVYRNIGWDDARLEVSRV